VDGARRLDFRRQHTGQHILSAALLSSAGARTVSANLGEELTTVEVDLPALGGSALAAAEELANRIVNANHPVLLHWVSPEEAARFPLRKPPPPGRERLRIVEIPGIDASACGGLHTASTGEVGLILFNGQEKIRGRVRLAWKIGERAWRELRGRERVLAEVGAELTCGAEAIPASVRALKARLKAQELALGAAEKGLAALQADRLLAEAPAGGGLQLVCHRLEGSSPGMLPALFQALMAHPHTVACLGGPAGGGTMPWLIGCSEDLELPLDSILPPLLPLIEGKGGGRGRRWQGAARRPQGWAQLCAELAGRVGAAAPGANS
jgi:alanyl-tRNA synthetase